MAPPHAHCRRIRHLNWLIFVFMMQVEDALHLAKLLTCIEQLKAQNARYLAKRAQEKGKDSLRKNLYSGRIRTVHVCLDLYSILSSA